MNVTEKLRKVFREKYKCEPILIAAPGRVNLIGEHTDYNGGFVLPCAVQFQVTLAMAPNALDKFRCYSEGFGETEFSLSEFSKGHTWAHYIMGVIQGIHSKGFSVKGFDLAITSDIPAGAGLSSSAALCCGVAFGISILEKINFSRLDLAFIAQQAEHEFVGVKCGLMDQYASLFGVKNSAILLDCRSVAHVEIPLNLGSYALLLINSGVKHQLAESAYNRRRESCEEGVKSIAEKFPISSLRDVSMEILEDSKIKMSEEVYRRCCYVVHEIKRTKEAAQLLVDGDLSGFGQRMYDTHEGLSKFYEVSCEESDYLVSLAKESGMVLGARMMGGGFGGCTLNLIRKDQIHEFSDYVVKNYVARFKKEPDFYQVTAGDGVRLIE